jgi:hypothetical protein
MADIAWSDVTSLPGIPAKLLSVTGEAQTMILGYVNAELPPQDYDDGNLAGNGPQYKLARCYMAAHMALVGPRWGFVSSEDEDDLSIGYTLPPIPPGAAFWASTGFGMAFWQMRQSSLGRLPWVL